MTAMGCKMNATASILAGLIAPLDAPGICMILATFFTGIAGVIYSIRGVKPPVDTSLPETVNRLGNAVVNMQDNLTKVALATPQPTARVVVQPTLLPVQKLEQKP